MDGATIISEPSLENRDRVENECAEQQPIADVRVLAKAPSKQKNRIDAAQCIEQDSDKETRSIRPGHDFRLAEQGSAASRKGPISQPRMNAIDAKWIEQDGAER